MQMDPSQDAMIKVEKLGDRSIYSSSLEGSIENLPRRNSMACTSDDKASESNQISQISQNDWKMSTDARNFPEKFSSSSTHGKMSPSQDRAMTSTSSLDNNPASLELPSEDDAQSLKRMITEAMHHDFVAQKESLMHTRNDSFPRASSISFSLSAAYSPASAPEPPPVETAPSNRSLAVETSHVCDEQSRPADCIASEEPVHPSTLPETHEALQTAATKKAKNSPVELTKQMQFDPFFMIVNGEGAPEYGGESAEQPGVLIKSPNADLQIKGQYSDQSSASAVSPQDTDDPNALESPSAQQNGEKALLQFPDLAATPTLSDRVATPMLSNRSIRTRKPVTYFSKTDEILHDLQGNDDLFPNEKLDQIARGSRGRGSGRPKRSAYGNGFNTSKRGRGGSRRGAHSRVDPVEDDFSAILASMPDSSMRSGLSGVYFHLPKREWRAVIGRGTKRQQKTFSVRKYGFTEAKHQAEYFRSLFDKSRPAYTNQRQSFDTPAKKQKFASSPESTHDSAKTSSHPDDDNASSQNQSNFDEPDELPSPANLQHESLHSQERGAASGSTAPQKMGSRRPKELNIRYEVVRPKKARDTFSNSLFSIVKNSARFTAVPPAPTFNNNLYFGRSPQVVSPAVSFIQLLEDSLNKFLMKANLTTLHTVGCILPIAQGVIYQQAVIGMPISNLHSQILPPKPAPLIPLLKRLTSLLENSDVQM